MAVVFLNFPYFFSDSTQITRRKKRFKCTKKRPQAIFLLRLHFCQIDVVLHTRDHAALATSSNCLATCMDLARIQDVPVSGVPLVTGNPAPPANDDYEPLLHHAPPSQTTPIPWLAPVTTTTAAWGRDPAQHDTIPGLPGHAYSPPGQQGPILHSTYSWTGDATNVTCPMTNVARSLVLPY